MPRIGVVRLVQAQRLDVPRGTPFQPVLRRRRRTNKPSRPSAVQSPRGRERPAAGDVGRNGSGSKHRIARLLARISTKLSNTSTRYNAPIGGRRPACMATRKYFSVQAGYGWRNFGHELSTMPSPMTGSTGTPWPGMRCTAPSASRRPRPDRKAAARPSAARRDAPRPPPRLSSGGRGSAGRRRSSWARRVAAVVFHLARAVRVHLEQQPREIVGRVAVFPAGVEHAAVVEHRGAPVVVLVEAELADAPPSAFMMHRLATVLPPPTQGTPWKHRVEAKMIRPSGR
jgi:hypothetical protein